MIHGYSACMKAPLGLPRLSTFDQTLTEKQEKMVARAMRLNGCSDIRELYALRMPKGSKK